MKVICKQQDLSRGLSTVSHAVSNRSTLPILSNILMTTDQGHLKLAATNLEIGITCSIDAEIDEEGSTTIPAKMFIDLVNSLRQGQVELSVPAETHEITIKSTGSNATIKGMDSSEFPLIPSAEGGEAPIILDASQLKEIIAEVVIACATDDTRPVLSCVLIEMVEDQMTFAAADAFRLALRQISFPGYEGTFNSLLIPAKTRIHSRDTTTTIYARYYRAY